MAKLAPEYIPRLPSSTPNMAVNTPTPLLKSTGSMYVQDGVGEGEGGSEGREVKQMKGGVWFHIAS